MGFSDINLVTKLSSALAYRRPAVAKQGTRLAIPGKKGVTNTAVLKKHAIRMSRQTLPTKERMALELLRVLII